MDVKACISILNDKNDECNDINERNLIRKRKVKIHAFITILHSIISLITGSFIILIHIYFI